MRTNSKEENNDQYLTRGVIGMRGHSQHHHQYLLLPRHLGMKKETVSFRPKRGKTLALTKKEQKDFMGRKENAARPARFWSRPREGKGHNSGHEKENSNSSLQWWVQKYKRLILQGKTKAAFEGVSFTFDVRSKKKYSLPQGQEGEERKRRGVGIVLAGRRGLKRFRVLKRKKILGFIVEGKGFAGWG